MKVLSLFDGMACGMIAMKNAGIEVESYDAYEIDKYAITVTQHNFPTIQQHGDVFKEDFTKYEGVDYLIGGSPCTYWSIAQKNNRETEASGMGWELFSQYVRALREAKPKFFIYENNKSMSKAIRASIDEAFGFEAVYINSALVSAQNRQRLYWVGMRNADGTYSKVPVEQPEDLGILLKDVLDGVADPVCVAERGRYEDGVIVQHFEARTDGKTNALTTVQKDNNVAEPFRVGALPRPNGELSTSQAMRVYSVDGKSTTQSACGGGMGGKTGLYAVPVDCPTMRVREATKQGYVDIEAGDCVDMTMPNSKTRRGRSMKDKCNCVMTGCQYYQYCGTLAKPIYEVKDGMITIKDKQYPIKLVDGYYIIRKLTVTECMRLQTVPEWYDFSVISDSQAYKCLGNGWTCDVITHLINATMEAIR